MSKTRVLVVDDSVVIRKLVSDLLNSDPDIEVVGTAVNGRVALHKIEQLQPDLVTMDIEMPDLDGIATVRELRRTGNRVPVVMFSTMTEQGAHATLEALAAGATDYVTKPANVGSVGRSLEQVRTALIPRIKALVPRTSSTPGTAPAAPAAPGNDPTPVLTRARPSRRGYRMLVVASSTGGPEALGTLLGALPRLDVPVAVVQHMPPVFTKQFAARLDRQLPYPVREAEHGAPLDPGTVTIAAGDHHLRVASRGHAWTAMLDQGPAENYCRPAADVLFRSAAEATGGAVLAVVLTGMGHDGCRGAQAIVSRGGSVIVQDQATSVVWGMPGSVAAAGLAEQILPLRELASAITGRLSSRSTAAVPTPVHASAAAEGRS